MFNGFCRKPYYGFYDVVAQHPDLLNYADGECLAALGHMCESEMVYIQAGLNCLYLARISLWDPKIRYLARISFLNPGN